MPGHPADLPGPFALVDDLEAPALDDQDEHHLRRVLRLRPGDPLVVGDGRGGWRPARFGPALEPRGPIERSERDVPAIGVAFALVKGHKAELVVQKLTELGVDLIVPFRAARSVVQWDEARAIKAHARLEAVARAATMQCHRPWLPVVEEVADLVDVMDRPGAALAQRTGAPATLERPFVLVGPEGGWAPEELALAKGRGLPTVGIGTHVLRAETAAVGLGAVLTAQRAVAPESLP